MSVPPVFSRTNAGSELRDQEERRVVYIGGIPKHFTTENLCQLMKCFGDITNCSVHIRQNRYKDGKSPETTPPFLGEMGSRFAPIGIGHFMFVR